MASDVDISNLALALLGDDATVSNLNPPEGSAQAAHCQRFYPMSRDSLLCMHNWNFATRRAVNTDAPATYASSVNQWQYSYALPANTLEVIGVLPPDAPDDYNFVRTAAGWQCDDDLLGSQYAPQPFVVEAKDDGSLTIYTNQQNADLRYIVRVVDTTKFTPLFIDALGHFLASKLAGPVIKGDVGRAESKGQLELFRLYFGMARDHDARQRLVKPKHQVSWIAGR